MFQVLVNGKVVAKGKDFSEAFDAMMVWSEANYSDSGWNFISIIGPD